jgi:hypothetical protein
MLLVLAALAFAGVRTGGTGQGYPYSTRGTYSVVDVLAGGLEASYGMAIKDNTANSVWILNWSDVANYEFDMVSGSATGNSWPITGGVDPDDQAYANYAGGNQWFMTDYASSWFAVFEEDGTFLRAIDGPPTYTNLFGIGATDGYVYIGSPNESKLAWGAYTGTESAITWSEIDYADVYGLAVWGDYLFVALGVGDADNIFIHHLNPDGSPNPTPEWSCMFTEEVEVNGGIDYDGEYLWIYPQNTFLYKLSIDWDPSALEADTWAGIKASF